MQLLWALLCGGADPLAAPLVPTAAPQNFLTGQCVAGSCLPALPARSPGACSHETTLPYSQHALRPCPSPLVISLPIPIACSLPRPRAAAPGGQPHTAAVRAGAPTVRGRDAAGGARSRPRFPGRLLGQRPSHHLALALSLHLVTFCY
jgi:hypothetical protein